MKKDVHPEYREVLFHDTSIDKYFVVPSSLVTDETKEWEGKTYPYFPLDVCSECHPFYTGKQKLVDTGGRVDKFRKRFGSKNKAAVTSEAPAEEVVAEEVVAEEAVAEEAPAEEVPAEESVAEEVPAKKKKAPAKKSKKK